MISEQFHLKLFNARQWTGHKFRYPNSLQILTLITLALSLSLASVQTALSYNQKSFLWKVQSSRSTVYLLGSIHFLKEEVYPLNQTTETAFESSGKLVVEANINDLGNLDLKKLADRAFFKNDDNVEKHVSPETYRLIRKESKTLGMPIELLRMQKPWFLALSFQAMELVRLGYSPQQGVDYHFLTKAQGKKRILELESLEEQLNLLSGFLGVPAVVLVEVEVGQDYCLHGHGRLELLDELLLELELDELLLGLLDELLLEFELLEELLLVLELLDELELLELELELLHSSGFKTIQLPPLG